MRGWILTLQSAFAIILAPGCGTIGLFHPDCPIPSVSKSNESLSPIAHALRYLHKTQFSSDVTDPNQSAYAGDWPQCFRVEGLNRYVRDTSPFMATLVHHALAIITEETQAALDLSDFDISIARQMRQNSIELMLRFESDPQSPDRGTFGFWPSRSGEGLPSNLLLERLSIHYGQGPFLHGDRSPINVSFYPDAYSIPADADDTATIYAALLEHERLDGGPGIDLPFQRFFADWRDLGHVPRRNDAPWLPQNSGAFLTWFAYRDDPLNPRPNDVDIIVNANVLFALGRFDRLDTPGVMQSANVINAAILSGAHRDTSENLSLYYPNNFALHYCVTRAFYEGQVGELTQAAFALMEDLHVTVKSGPDQTAYWDRGDPHLNSAFGVLALLNTENDSAIIDQAIRYLILHQDQESGAWDPGAFFYGQFGSGIVVTWASPALTTAMAMEALCRYKLGKGERVPGLAVSTPVAHTFQDTRITRARTKP